MTRKKTRNTIKNIIKNFGDLLDVNYKTTILLLDWKETKYKWLIGIIPFEEFVNLKTIIIDWFNVRDIDAEWIIQNKKIKNIIYINRGWKYKINEEAKKILRENKKNIIYINEN